MYADLDIALGDTDYFWAAANNASGSGADADSGTINYFVRLGGAAADAAPVATGTGSLLSNAGYPPGLYEITISPTYPTYTTGSRYGIFSTLTVDSQNPSGLIGRFVARAADSAAEDGLTRVLAALPATALNDFDPANDTVARVTLVDTTTTLTNASPANVTQLNGSTQSLLDLKDFADDGYDPSTDKVQGVVLTDTATTVTNTVQANMAQVSGDTTSAANFRTMLDGTGGKKLTLEQLRIDSSSAGGGIDVDNSAGPGVQFTGGGNSAGMYLEGSGSGAGLRAQAGETGNGIETSGGATSGNGLRAYGSSGSGSGINASGGATNGAGMLLQGTGAAAGLRAVGGATGHGLSAAGGATSGDGINAAAQTSGDGISATGVGTGDGIEATAGASGVDIDADIAGTITTATNVTNRVTANVDQIGGDGQSATDLKDFADSGYDPDTNKVQGVVLTDTATTVTNALSLTATERTNIGNALLAIDLAGGAVDYEAVMATGSTLGAMIAATRAAMLGKMTAPSTTTKRYYDVSGAAHYAAQAHASDYTTRETPTQG